MMYKFSHQKQVGKYVRFYEIKYNHFLQYCF